MKFYTYLDRSKVGTKETLASINFCTINAYKIDPESRKIYVSRDVVFEEKKTWNWRQTEATESIHTGNFVVTTDYPEENVNVEERMHESRDESENENNEDVQSADASNYSSDVDEPPVKFKSLNEIYAATEPMELEDDGELYLMGIDEPANLYTGSQRS